MTGSMPDRQVPAKTVRRVLIGFGSAATGSGILDMVSDLARALKVELAGLFVEEELLYQISDLPTSSAIGASGQVVPSMDRASVGQIIAGRAQACRRALSQSAKKSNLQWSYEVQHGEALGIIRMRVTGDDILLITGTTASTTPRAKMELATQMRMASGANLIVPEYLRRNSGPVVVLHPEGDGHFDLAMRVAASLGERLIGVSLSKADKIEPGFSTSKFPRMTAEHPAQLVPILTSLQPRLLVASHSDSIFADSSKAGELLRTVGAPFLLVNF